MTSFFEQLRARSISANSLLCVGLDPDFRKHKPGEIAAYNQAIIEATVPFVACYKPNIAFFEALGA
ncbi:MAG: orotidine 5'-phosphate decarboxylase, partial [Dehalococcoidia bacterium]|nr:orotidine 5'-phosphate decarboxylase [Dehalococcoidia bacterium]